VIDIRKLDLLYQQLSVLSVQSCTYIVDPIIQFPKNHKKLNNINIIIY